MKDKIRILFLCTGNSCRSQMAEAWANHLLADKVEAFTAGLIAHGLDPMAVRAMAEVGIDISGNRSKSWDEFLPEHWDYVIPLCNTAYETCPFFPGAGKIVHHGFDDPPTLARDERDEDKAMNHYRRVRDEIKAFVEKLPQDLENRDE